MLTAANIVGPEGQGIAPSLGGVNEFDELVEMILDGLTYANVHSANSGRARCAASCALTKDTGNARPNGQRRRAGHRRILAQGDLRGCGDVSV